MAKWRHVARVGLVALALVLLILIGLHGMKATTVIGLISCLLAMVGLEKIFDPLLNDLIVREKHAMRGAEAEVTVGEILNRLPENHVVLHDIAAQFGNIDHPVFRRDGALFLIETKSHGGIVDEKRAGTFIPQTHRNIFWLRYLLKVRFGCDVWINAAIVFPKARVIVRRTLHGVDVIGLAFLERWIANARGRPEVERKLWPKIDELKAELVR